MSKTDNWRKYRHIVAWGRLLGSYSYYIADEVDRAAADNAPADAIYKNTEGKWQTYRDITNEGTKQQLDLLLAKP
jgi:hypothetical protein